MKVPKVVRKLEKPLRKVRKGVDRARAVGRKIERLFKE